MFHNRYELTKMMTGKEVAETYNALRSHFAAEAPISMKVNLADLEVAPTGLLIAGQEVSINDRAESVLNERLGLGKMREILPEDQFESIVPSINEYLNALEGSITFKSRRGQIQGVVSDRYREIPYTDVLTIMEHVGAHPIRVFHNDYNMKLQAVVPEYKLSARDEAGMNLGVQLKTSDMGAGALSFDVFLYRWACANGMIMGKKSIGSFRTIHVQSLNQAEADTRRELNRVLTDAAEAVDRMIDSVINRKMDEQRVMNFLQKQPIGKKALAYVAEQLAGGTNMWDAVNVLTEAGHNPQFSQSLQFAFEHAAGELLAVAA